MAKNYSIHFLIRDRENGKGITLPVRKGEQDRLRSILDGYSGDTNRLGFVWLDAIDGRSVAINLKYVQAVRYLWEPSSAPPDAVRFEGQVSIYLCGRAEPLVEGVADPVGLYDFFSNLQYGADIVAFPHFEDVDGETIQFNASEIMWVVAPKIVLDEGSEIISNEEAG